MKKILIITYYWPPAGGGGVQRIAKFCKHLPACGWEPVVLTVQNGNFAAKDASLLQDVQNVRRVERAPSLEPHTLYRKFAGVKIKPATGEVLPDASPPNATWKHQLGEWIRLNLFIPDSRICWKRPAIRKGLTLLDQEKPDLIFSTSPPYTPHLIARALHQHSGIPWVVDYRDPWIENHAYNTAPRLPPVLWINRRMESRTLLSAQAITTANPRLTNLVRSKLPADAAGKVHTLTNGYDPDDLPETAAPPSDHFEISYYGTVYEKGFPDALFEVFAEEVAANPAFAKSARLCFTGTAAPTVRDRISRTVPSANLTFRSYLPHEVMLRELFSPRLLTLVINDFPGNEATVPGKVYEALPTGNPVLGIGPVPGDAADMLAHSPNAVMTRPEDRETIRRVYRDSFADWQAGRLNTGRTLHPDFDRRELTQRLANLFTNTASAPRSP